MRAAQAGGLVLVRVLGPLDVVDDAGVECAVTAAHQRRVLARLATASPRSVSAGTLIDAVWGESPPGTALAALQNYVSALRKLLGPDAIVSDAGGYRLNGDRVQVDAAVFEHLITGAHEAYAERRPVSALAQLDQALGLWRGEPLDDVTDSDAVAAAERLRELRLRASEQRAQCHLDLDRAADIAAELPSLVAEHPLRERLVELLMTALYRTGRQAEALATYQDLRRRLANELGLDPSPALQRLERDVLNQASDLLPAAPVVEVPLSARVPAAADELIGRDDTLAQLEELLRDGVRLLSIVGPGGIGKTRLAASLATAAATHFDRVGFVRLETATSPEAAVSRIADDLGVPSTTTTAIPPALADLLGAGSWLLVLDNVEQVTGIARHVGDLLEACPRLTLVVTSRVALGARGEHVHHLSPLALSDGVRLITERARAADAAVRFDESDSEHLAAICTALDGLPLALELAAPRLTAVTPAELASRLRHSVLTMSGGSDRPDRHRTLHDTVDWSYRLVSEAAQRLLRTLAVFRGGATLEALEHVVGGDVAAELVELRAAALVSLDRDAGRYRLLETIREFGVSALDADEAATVRARHASYFVSAARANHDLYPPVLAPEPMMSGGAPPLAPEVANLESAFEWLSERDSRSALTVGLPLSTLFTQSGRIDDRRRLFKILRALAPDRRTELAMGYLEAAGRFTTGQEVNAAEVDQLLRDAVELADDRLIADISQYLSIMWSAEAAIDRAREVIDLGLDAAVRTGDPLLLARTCGCAFSISLVEGDADRALHEGLQYRDLTVRHARSTEQANAYVTLAHIVLLRDQQAEYADELLDEAERILCDSSLRHNLLEIRLADARGWTALVRGDAPAAAVAYRQALHLRAEMTTEGFVADSIAGVAVALLLKDRYDEAATFFDAVDDLGEINPAWRATSYLVPVHQRYADVARARTQRRAVSWIRHYDLRQVMTLAMAACDEIT
jgi:predicted ATPase/DNA-binding SARP family transcriptional activator